MPLLDKRMLTAVAALALPLAAAGCSGAKLPTVGSINPFSSSKTISETDRVFLMAAGSWDRNRDNQVTCDEWKAYANELFSGADANGDGELDSTEWASVVAVDRMFTTANLDYFDTNNDNKVSHAEFVDRQNPAFKLLDTANSCVLSGDQVAGARSQTEYDVSGKPKETSDPTATKNPDVLGRN
ncbi:MAG TPA: histidine kinase [Hyphomicrobium sp.]|nr:histidine kinase [Hyphomicrobium sp.]